MLEDFGFFNCSSDVKAEMDAFCTGRKECHVKVDDTAFTRATPCHADLKNHLQLTYSCVKGQLMIARVKETGSLEN